MIYSLIAAVVLTLVLSTGAYFKGRADGAEPLVEKIAALEASIRIAKTEGDERAKRSEEVAKEATASMAKLRTQLEANRETSKKAAAVAWDAYFGATRVRPNNDSVEAALAACRADEDAVRGTVNRLVSSAYYLHEVATVNTEQLKLLQRWASQVSR